MLICNLFLNTGMQEMFNHRRIFYTLSRNAIFAQEMFEQEQVRVEQSSHQLVYSRRARPPFIQNLVRSDHPVAFSSEKTRFNLRFKIIPPAK